MKALLALLALLVACTCNQTPWTTSGMPPNARCGTFAGDVGTCVADGKLYVCVRDWRHHETACARAYRGEESTP